MTNISFEEFKKLDLRVGKVISAEKIVGSTNLLKLAIDMGKEKRQILAGISKYYDPKELIGMSLVIVTNLEPKKMMGLDSQGMILCAESTGDEPVCLAPLKEVPPGSRVL
jgi:methionine--tRNA ligase beta chain